MSPVCLIRQNSEPQSASKRYSTEKKPDRREGGTRLACFKQPVDNTIRKYANFDEMKADEYRYW